jgi:hypothetical protein
MKNITKDSNIIAVCKIDGGATFCTCKTPSTKVIHALYLGSEEEHKWSVADMDKLVDWYTSISNGLEYSG